MAYLIELNFVVRLRTSNGSILLTDTFLLSTCVGQKYYTVSLERVLDINFLKKETLLNGMHQEYSIKILVKS